MNIFSCSSIDLNVIKMSVSGNYCKFSCYLSIKFMEISFEVDIFRQMRLFCLIKILHILYMRYNVEIGYYNVAISK